MAPALLTRKRCRSADGVGFQTPCAMAAADPLLPGENAGTALLSMPLKAEQTELCPQKDSVSGTLKDLCETDFDSSKEKALQLITPEVPHLTAQGGALDIAADGVDQKTVTEDNLEEKNAGKKRIVGPNRNWAKMRRQKFDYFLIMDLEWTCNEYPPQPKPQEIWEFATVLLNARTLKIEDQFHTLCRPEVHPILSDFCKEKMQVTQEEVDKSGMVLKDVLEVHDAWLIDKGLLDEREEPDLRERQDMVNFAVVTWSSWDCKILDPECRHKHIRKPAYFDRWIDLREFWTRMYKVPYDGLQGGLRARVEYSGLEWVGREHSAIDDAINTARLAADMIQKGELLEMGRHEIDNEGNYNPNYYVW